MWAWYAFVRTTGVTDTMITHDDVEAAVRRRDRESRSLELRISLERRMLALPAKDRDEVRNLILELFLRQGFESPGFYRDLNYLMWWLHALESGEFSAPLVPAFSSLEE